MGYMDQGYAEGCKLVEEIVKKRKEKFGSDWWKPECEIEKMNLKQYREYVTIYECYKYSDFLEHGEDSYRDICNWHDQNDTTKKLNNMFEKLVGPEFVMAYENFRDRRREQEPEWEGDTRYRNFAYTPCHEMAMFLEACVLISNLKNAKTFMDYLKIATDKIYCYWDIVHSPEEDKKLKEEIIDRVVRKNWDKFMDIRAIHSANNKRIYEMNKKRKEKSYEKYYK